MVNDNYFQHNLSGFIGIKIIFSLYLHLRKICIHYYVLNMKNHYCVVKKSLPLFLTFLLFFFAGCNKHESSITKLSMLEGGKTFAVPSGTVADQMVLKRFPDAKIIYFNSILDCALAVREGKADAASYDKPVLVNIAAKVDGLAVLDELIMDDKYGFAVKLEDTDLKKVMDKVLAEIKSDGTYKEMSKRWFPKQGNPEPMPTIELTGTNGVLRFGTAAVTEPMSFVDGNQKVVGFDIEYATYIAKKLGKKLEIVNMEFGAMLPALISGKVDMVGAGLSITKERAKSVLFSESYYPSGIAVIVKSSSGESKASPKEDKFRTIDDIADKTIGIYSGTVQDAYIAEHYPKAKVKQYDLPANMVLALQTGKIDAIMFDQASTKVMVKNNPDLALLSDNVFSMPVGVGFSKKNPKLRNEFNAYLKAIKENGTYDEMYKRWFEDDPEKAVMPIIKNPASTKTITAAVSVNDLPYVSYSNEKFVGFDIEMIQRFAEYAAYHLEMEIIDFPALVAALSSGKVDLISDGICINEERSKAIDFSDSYTDLKTAVVVLKKDMQGGTKGGSGIEKKTFLKSISESFYNNLILEKRYKLILDGLKVTIIISILAALLGSILGGMVCFMRMSKKKFLSGFARIYISLLRGTPVLVLLMIIFYVVFASVNINPVIVAILAFGLNFAAYVSEMFRTSIQSVDKGQNEAGIASGFTKIRAFVHIVMPQALRQVLPVYKGEFISLMKMTSVVGYIAVQDITRASDIIRSRTFDAFFPLLIATVIYLVLAWTLTWALDKVEISVDPKRKRIKRIKEVAR